jgi:hypothetical protein
MFVATFLETAEKYLHHISTRLPLRVVQATANIVQLTDALLHRLSVYRLPKFITLYRPSSNDKRRIWCPASFADSY